jgi:short-subunit dehydrogenase
MAIEVEVESMLERVRRNHGAVRLIVHAAGILSDGLIRNQDESSMQRVFGPKADGAWYLHKHTLNDNIEKFILFSSLSALFGTIGQVNYSAANFFLDSLAANRHANGLPATSIRWPGISSIGMVAAMAPANRLLNEYCISPTQARNIILRLILEPLDIACVNIIPKAIFCDMSEVPVHKSFLKQVIHFAVSSMIGLLIHICNRCF